MPDVRGIRERIQEPVGDHTLNIEVHDDGCGGAHTGFGLTSVHDRVASIGGSLSLRSPPGAGTQLTVTI